MNTKQPATPPTPFQAFYGSPSPSGAVTLALADSFAYVAPLMPDGDYVKMLRKAKEHCDAYPRLVEALREAREGIRVTAERDGGTLRPQLNSAYESLIDLLRSLGEAQ